MQKKTILSGVLCFCMLCPSAFALNTSAESPSIPVENSSYTIQNNAASPASKSLSDVVPVSVPLSSESKEKTAVSERTATNSTAAIDAPTAAPAENTSYCVGTRATVTALETEDRPGTLEVKTGSGETLVLQILDGTAFVDNQSGVAVPVTDIKVGAEIYAYTSPIRNGNTVTTLAVLTNLGDNTIAQLHKIDSSSVANDLADALCDNGSIIIRTSEATAFSPYLTKQFVSAQEMQPGVSFLAWYDVVAESYPAQATATRIVILPEDTTEPESTAAASDTTPVSDGVAVVKVGEKIFTAEKNGEAYQVPARAIGEALGLTVDWYKDNGYNFVSLYNDSGVMSMTIDKNEYVYWPSVLDAAVAKPLEITPHFALYQDAESATWVDINMFEMMGFHITNADGVLTIQ